MGTPSRKLNMPFLQVLCTVAPGRDKIDKDMRVVLAGLFNHIEINRSPNGIAWHLQSIQHLYDEMVARDAIGQCWPNNANGC